MMGIDIFFSSSKGPIEKENTTVKRIPLTKTQKT